MGFYHSVDRIYSDNIYLKRCCSRHSIQEMVVQDAPLSIEYLLGYLANTVPLENIIQTCHGLSMTTDEIA